MVTRPCDALLRPIETGIDMMAMNFWTMSRYPEAVADCKRYPAARAAFNRYLAAGNVVASQPVPQLLHECSFWLEIDFSHTLRQLSEICCDVAEG
ncbi:hypothetical protein ACVIYL_000123 [Bradyrhizobium sp. USDA 3315]